MTQSFAHFFGLWRGPGCSAEQRAGVLALTQARNGKHIVDETSLQLAAFGSDPWPSANVRVEGGTAAIVLGEPVYLAPQGAAARTEFLEALNTQGVEPTLQRCQGSFAGLLAGSDGLQLFSDALGLRPLYYRWLDDGHLLFASQLGALKAMHQRLGLPLCPDEQGLAESIAFGISLGQRTVWQGVTRLRQAALLRAAGGQMPSLSRYAEWPTAIDESLSEDAAAAQIDAAMDLAVRDRLTLLPPGSGLCAFLSGGMDSRYLVAKLVQRADATQVHTLNVAPAGSQDAELGTLAAQCLGTLHLHAPTRDSLAAGMATAVRRVQASTTKSCALWWSGDGGSVGLGHVYLTDGSSTCEPLPAEMLAHRLMQDNRWQFAGRSLNQRGQRLCALPMRGAAAELKALDPLPPQKRAFAFLLLNDQQRHLDAHFERLGDQGHDLILPFFDARLIQQLLRTPTRHLLRHRLYNRLFASRIGAVGHLPWQAYPGHEPCPYPMPTNLRLQWEGWHDSAYQRREQRRLARSAAQALLRGPKPEPLSRARVSVAALLTWLGWRDLRYVLKEADRLWEIYS